LNAQAQVNTSSNESLFNLLIEHKVMPVVEVKWIKLNEAYKNVFVEALNNYVITAHYMIKRDYKKNQTVKQSKA